MSNVVKFPETDLQECKAAFDKAVADPGARVFAGFVFDKDGACGVFFPDELMLSDILLAKAILDDAAQTLLRSQVE